MVEEARFPGQQEGENVIIFSKRHWYILSQWLRGPFLLLFLSALVTRFAFDALDIEGVRALLAWSIALAPASLWILWRVLDWWNDHYIVTDRRVIHIERIYARWEKRDEAHLDRVQDVAVEVPTIMSNLLGFGNVLIATAGTTGTITFNSVPEPQRVQAQILALVAKAKERAGKEDLEAIKAVREMLGLPRQEAQRHPQPSEQPSPEGEEAGQGLRQFIASLLCPSIPSEPGLLVWRKHWWALFNALMSPLITLAIAIIGWLSGRILLGEGLPLWASFLFASSLTLIVIWIIWRSIDWQNDLYIVTNERVIDIEKIPLVFEHRREASLGMIQDVSYTKPSFIAQRLDFGDVRLETAAEAGLFTFDSVPHPQQVQTEIFKRLEQFRLRSRRGEEERKQAEFVELLARYHRAVTRAKEGE